MPNLNSLAPTVSEIPAFIRTDGQTDIRTCASDPDQEYIYFMGSETLNDQEYIYFVGSETLPSALSRIYILYGVGNASFCL